MNVEKQKDDHVISYLLMRKLIGILGIALPFILCLGAMLIFKCDRIQVSISHYYHTGMRNIFLAVVFMIAFFLYSYKGYDKDYIYTRIAAILALIVAFFPTLGSKFITTEGLTLPSAFQACQLPAMSDSKVYNYIHLFSAAAFLLVLAYISLKLFTKSEGHKTLRKKARNKVYIVCGIIMISCVVLAAIYIYARNSGAVNWDDKYPPVFILESLALIAFGVSWLIKGEALLGDREPDIPHYTSTH